MKRYLLSCLVLALLAMALVGAEKYTLTGKVTDTQGNPIVAATVIIKGTKNGTATNSDGSFSLQVTGKEKLVISAIGFSESIIEVRNQRTMIIQLSPVEASLEEVVVTVPYGTVRKTAFTGSEPTIRIRGSASVKVKNVTSALEGMAPGLYGQRAPAEDKSDFSREGYDRIEENPFLKATDKPLSTFSIDVDAASYSNIRRFINQGQLPPAGAVRIEEMINYFSYDYKQPQNDVPFNVHMEASECPWNTQHQLVLIGIQGKKIANDSLPPANLVFLIDVSGSMESSDKLPLVQSSMKLLADQLRPQDKVSIVVYAGNAGLVLPATPGNKKGDIRTAIEQLRAGGSTAGGQGIKLAYKVARENFIQDGNNRVILCTDGDFNVGTSSDDELVAMIEKERTSGVFLTILGFGMGNYQDAKMQKLANKGNGNHAYIDNLKEAGKVLVKEAGGTLYTIAKDVKLQIEFNPAKVQGYRLIGYENRMLAAEDFNDDTKDAGELGSGHTVTALYEIIPVGVKANELRKIDSLRYKATEEPFAENAFGDELMFVKMRFKKPDSDQSRLTEFACSDDITPFANTSENFRFASAVAQLGMLLRNSQYKGTSSYKNVIELARNAKGKDTEGYRNEFLALVKKASEIKVGL